MKEMLVLEDGKVFTGESIGVPGERIGEVILNTAVVGYQEMMTDPANAGKILVLTYPLIGNYGIAPKFNESGKIWLAGLVIKERSKMYSNWQAKESLDDFIIREKLTALAEVDTRTLAVHLRNKGSMLGIISAKDSDVKTLLSKISAFRKEKKETLLPEISVKKPRQIGAKAGKYRIALLDLGVTNSVIRQLEALDLAVTLLPYNTPVQEILRLKPRGLIISGGPEADAGLKEVAENLKCIVGKIPIMGIATGHQVLALALGAKINKMKIGHRGVNYPVQSPKSFKGEITAQNHGLVVDADSLRKIKEVKITGFNLNDRSVEEMESKKLKLIGVQYIPASPGFSEVNPLFKRFIKMSGGR
ncbi:MAG: glutamine-hydrolyzing carbamoyl-phosphate synthase small subunit [Candidatus Omnitrophica bacterium]|nr:glutamine-hydrolyzing carbamoyl-phosphate synthase small subunit [Candidatus Omnitrophota bacterium]